MWPNGPPGDLEAGRRAAAIDDEIVGCRLHGRGRHGGETRRARLRSDRPATSSSASRRASTRATSCPSRLAPTTSARVARPRPTSRRMSVSICRRTRHAAATGSANTATSSGSASGTRWRFGTGARSHSAKAPSRPRMPIASRRRQCVGRPFAQQLQLRPADARHRDPDDGLPGLGGRPRQVVAHADRAAVDPGGDHPPRRSLSGERFTALGPDAGLPHDLPGSRGRSGSRVRRA